MRLGRPASDPLPPFFSPDVSTGAGLAPPDPGPGLSSLLLGLGVALLVTAAIIFAAVTWNRLGAVGQGALLVGLTVVAGAATGLAQRRRLVGDR